MPSAIFLIVMIVLMGGMMWWQSRNAKKQQQQRQDFQNSLQPGTEVITNAGLVAKVVSVDEQYDEIVLESEGSRMRFFTGSMQGTPRAVVYPYVRPAFVSDDEVDENGNPLIQTAEDDQPVQESIDVDQPEAQAQDTAEAR